MATASGHCLHKLPTRCQLTAQSTCCACGDKRPQASSFNRYIDGVGFVLGGRRQERYCPNCQQFWDARIEISGLPQSSTRIPLVPDQTTFIKQWYDWHRGYSIHTNPDGSEEHQALTGESLSEVSLGHLPRTTEELQARDTEQINTQPFITQQHATTPFMTSSSSRFIATDIDPEDRIFDSSSSSEPSESSASSDNEELPESPSSAQQRLLLNLQQNVEDIRTNVAQLTRSIPQYRASSQISTISDQLSSIRRSLGTIRRHPPSRTRQHPTGQAMAARISTHGNSQSEGHHQGSDDSAHVPASGSFNLLNDEELRQHIDLLQSQMERAITDGSTRDGSNVAVATLRRIGRRLQQASQEVNRRRGISSAFGTLGEAGMQGQNYPSPLTSHFTPSAPGEEQDSHLVNYSTETQPQVADEDQRSSDSLRVLSGSDHNSTEGHGWPRREALGYPTASHSRAPPRSNASSTGAVDGSDPSTPRTTFLDSDGLYNSIFSGVPQARYESDYLSRLRVPRVNPEGSSSYSSQLPRPSSALSSIDGTGPRVWRHGPPREVPEAASANLAALGRPSLRYPRSPRSRELDFIIAARAQYPRNTVGRQSFTARASDGPDNPLASYSPEPNDFDGFFPDVGVLRRAQYPRATVGPQSSTAGISDEPVAPRTTNELNWMSAEEAAAENAAFLGQYPSLAQDPDRWMYHLGRPVVPGGRPERQQRQAQPSLDNDTTRPEPVLEEAKRVLVECKICFAQISNQAMLPCGHCCMCRWCSMQLFPRHSGDRTRPSDRSAACPVCRNKVKQIVEIYYG